MAATNRTLSAERIVNIEDLRRMAQRRVPKAVFDYLDGGAEAEASQARAASLSRMTLAR